MPNNAANECADGQTDGAGPVLFLHGTGHGHGRLRLATLVIRHRSAPAPVVVVGNDAVVPEPVTEAGALRAWRARFELPLAGGAYTVDGTRHEVAGVSGADLRLAFVSCNGQEHGDRERRLDERNALWERLVAADRHAPLSLLLHGGDQLYADEMLELHPSLLAWRQGCVQALSPATLATIREQLRAFLMARYRELLAQAAPARLLARVPSLCMWDDHDICDGWGSLPERLLDAPLGQLLFDVSREMFLVFQLGGHPDQPPPHCLEPSGQNLGWAVRLPGLAIIAPDLRSERRPQRVMGPVGWQAFEAALATLSEERTLVLSSVPALGPRLSWLEAAMHVLPGAQKYEDDLRDQWQSRWHRQEWQRFLRVLLAAHERTGGGVTLLSGEIHLATRGTMAAPPGPVHQLVASGITHPPPPGWYAQGLGWLARLGEAPLPEHPIRLHPLPGQPRIYTAQRNYLRLERRGHAWQAWWELERDGATPPVSLQSPLARRSAEAGCRPG